MNSELQYRPAPGVPFRLLPADGYSQVVIVDTRASRLVVLNRTGSRAWVLMGESGASPREIANHLASEWGLGFEEVVPLVETFLEKLLSRQLVESL
jgi:hypothetical protein